MSQNKVTIDLVGGIGNQLFQISAVLNYAKKYNYQPVFTNILNLPNYTGEPRYTYWDIFNSQNMLHLTEEENINKNQYTNYKEEQFNYTEFRNINKNTCLVGYYQSYKYIEPIKNKIFEIVNSSKLYNDNVDKLYNKIINKFNTNNLISIHIRRGDYLKYTDVHTNLEINYYLNAISKISDQFPVIVFSNDIKWCTNNLPIHISNPLYFVTYIENEVTEFQENQKIHSDILELLLMSRIKNNIIANSSFSWWGAYLNTHLDKTVIAPKKWFEKNGPKNWSDIYCKNWIILD
jgi:hypothetical protein